ncbi:hypothetical protein F2Q69_00036023 [Brassica cretica]|uniref:Uncharacterized protein n=1 Tax=Brassica cretica TaxID=69181 RepID=A0A8S9SFQ9_BRACR|nr:hypothetical protein F2Q69_00036023 [Brassica cretica]
MVITRQAPLKGSFTLKWTIPEHRNNRTRDHSTRRQAKLASHTQLNQRRVGPIDPTRHWASWTHHIQLAQRRVGSTESDSPLGELDDPFPTRPTASWISLI